MNNKPKLLIHVCCAVCGAALVEFLKDEYDLSLFFYNPNIHPEDEYKKRRDSARQLAKIYGVNFCEAKYDKENWFAAVKGLEGEPEGGKRCEPCFKMRLFKTSQFAEENFMTTLSLSPYKNEKIINETGRAAAEKFGRKFLTTEDLKIDKKEIWQKTRQLAKQHNFYHQKYCGCIFSQMR